MRALLGPQIDRSAMRLPMQANIGHRFQPDLQRRIERAEIRQFKARQEIAFDITDTALDASLQMSSRLHVM